MKKISDSYRLTTVSKSGKPGFDLFKDKKDGHYYFHFNDKNGDPFFYSEGYKTTKSQKNGVRSVSVNALLDDKYSFNSDADDHYFTLKAGNNQEIGRSKYFSAKKEMLEAISYLKNAISNASTKQMESSKSKMAIEPEKKNTTAEVKKPTETKKKPKAIKKSAPKAVEAPKYSFKVEMYPGDNGGPFRGRVIYLLNDEAAAFTGIDGNSIAAFIHSHLPEPEVVSEPKTKELKNKKVEAPFIELDIADITMLKKDEVKVWKNKIGESARAENLVLKLTKGFDGDPLESIHAGEHFYVSLSMKNGTTNGKKSSKDKPFKVELKLKNLEQERISPLAAFTVDLGKPGKNISPFPVELPERGMYRIIATVPPGTPRNVVGSILVAAY